MRGNVVVVSCHLLQVAPSLVRLVTRDQLLTVYFPEGIDCHDCLVINPVFNFSLILHKLFNTNMCLKQVHTPIKYHISTSVHGSISAKGYQFCVQYPNVFSYNRLVPNFDVLQPNPPYF